MNVFKIALLAIIMGALSGAFVSFAVLNFQSSSKEELIKDFYFVGKNTTHFVCR